MIGYVTIGAADVEAAMPFYDALFEAMGGERMFFVGLVLGERPSESHQRADHRDTGKESAPGKPRAASRRYRRHLRR